ncbi:hypothetical protein [Ohtaekwangia koreensis]|uniref:Uncharacterized protein n=1 Tax=Ohtaekwangia koreensis TaxID=688867 RepID=A0A1T5J879_9BACT|nr:hypothetical protein [Ohtaekwangia koreensis]SKC47544.1 hypothetical protein SAMN05660236_0858 [Ohtaekwangia koreensis]
MFYRKVLVLVVLVLSAIYTIGSPLPPADTSQVKSILKSLELKALASNMRSFNQLTVPQGNTTDPIIIPTQVFEDSTEYHRAKALEYQEEVTRKQSFITTLTDVAGLELPVALPSGNGDLNYNIIISRMRVDPRGAYIEAYVVLELPQTGDKIAFRGTDIHISNEGGLVGDGRLELIGSYHLRLNEKTLLTLLGKGNTYVEFGCDGFKSMSIEAQVEFSRDLFVPEDADGKVKPAPERVATKFLVSARNWNDLLIGVNFPSFQVTSLPGVGFNVTNAFLDFSDLANPPGIMFPKGYTSAFTATGNEKLWQGFYLKNTEIRLPKSFKENGNDRRLTFGAEDLIIDEQGLTGEVFVGNLLTAGDMSGWSYTIDKLGLEFVTNQVKGFELVGRLSVPVIKSKEGKTTQFGYIAQRGSDGNYLFSVTVDSELKFPLLFADLNLYKGSSVIVREGTDEKGNSKFYPTVILNGHLGIKTVSSGPKASFTGIGFQGLRISTEAPHFDIQAVSFGKEGAQQSASKYPLVINNISLRKDGSNKIGIGFDVTINIGGSSSDEGFGGTAGLVVWGKREIIEVKNAEGAVTGTDESNWKFDKVEITGIGVRFEKAGVIKIAGEIRFFEDDPIYGDGFKGSISGKISMITLKVEALFGKTPEFRYWYADGLVEFTNGIPLFPGFSAYGFGGGFYSKMKQSTDGNGSPIGRNASGIVYVPDENTIGIKALVKFGATPSRAPYNGDVGLEVALNRHGGINSITFTGNIVIMSPALPGGLEKIKEQAMAVAGDSKAASKLLALIQGQVSANVKILFDNVNDVLHANMEMYINVVGGVIKGIGPNNRAGWAVMHFAKDEWYVLVGTPNDPVGIELLWMLKMKSYFMVGKNLPGSPPPPRQVSEILGIDASDLDYMRDLNAAESGFGFAFGMDFSFDTGNLKFLMFYGRFAAGIGTDFMIKKYAKEYHCVGSDETIGINGWFANGQAYAYIQGKIGIKVKLRFYKGNYDILSIGAAAILQTKGPNPFWMRGIVGGHYKILGGLVKGNCKFEFEIGKQCTVVGNSNPLEDVDMIAGVTPAKDEKGVDVFNAPQAAFNIPIGEVFEITDLENRKRSFRGKLVEFSVKDGTNVIQGTTRWNEDNDVVVLDPGDVLPGKKELKVIVKITFEEKVNGVWKTVQFEGKDVEENVETTFTTGEAPDYIPSSNVSISYPLKGQYNFYPKEYNQGFIQLKKGQPELFTPGAEWSQKLHFTDGDAQSYVETDVSYNVAEKKVYFTIPGGIQTGKLYHMEILNIPLQNQVLDANVTKVETELAGSDGQSTVTTNNIEGNLTLRDAKTIYTLTLRTSQYNTFSEKMAGIKQAQTMREQLPEAGVFQLIAHLNTPEWLDEYEANGGDGFANLVQGEAILENTNWYNKYVYPLVYEGYPLRGNMTITNRDASLLGVPPVRSVYIEQASYYPVLTEKTTEVTNITTTGDLKYDVMRPMVGDYRDIQHQVANYVVDHPERVTTRFGTLLTSGFPFIKYGKYSVRFKYVIPGVNKVSSTFDMEMFNAIPD